MGSSLKAGRQQNSREMTKQSSSMAQPIDRPASLGPRATLLPEGVHEPTYIKDNKLRCWCGATRSTRAKYINHWYISHPEELAS